MAFDNDQLALNVLHHNLNAPVSCHDLAQFDESIVSRIKEADVLIAGPPCQGFSTAGNNNPKDARNGHLLNVARLAASALPKVVIIENVKGLLSRNNRDLFDLTKRTLEDAGYKVSWDIHSAAEHGLAQNRQRVIIVAVLSKAAFELKLKCEERTCLADVLSGISEIDDEPKKLLGASTMDFKIAQRIKPGQKLSNVRRGLRSVHTWEIPEAFGEVTGEETSMLETMVKLRRQNRRRQNGDADPVRLSVLKTFFGSQTLPMLKTLEKKGYIRRVDGDFDITNTFNGKYRRLNWEDLSPTVDTRFGQAKYFLHPDENRGFSFREAARIQSFPDEFEFDGSRSAIYRMIGNAVPPRLGCLIANEIRRVWL